MESCMLYPLHGCTHNWANAKFYFSVFIVHFFWSYTDRECHCYKSRLAALHFASCGNHGGIRLPKEQHGNHTETKRWDFDPYCRFSHWLALKKPKVPDKQTQNAKGAFLVLDFYLRFAVLRGRDVSEMHPLCNALQRERKGKALHQEPLSSQRPVTYRAMACPEDQRLLVRVAYSRRTFHRVSVGNCRKH